MKKSCLNRDSNTGSLAYCANVLTTELLRHMDQLTTFTIYNLYWVTYTPTILKFVPEFLVELFRGLLSDYFNLSVGENEHTHRPVPRLGANVTGGEKSCLNLDSNPGSLAQHARILTTELLRHTDQPMTLTI